MYVEGDRDGSSWRSVEGLMTRSRGDSRLSLGGLALGFPKDSL